MTWQERHNKAWANPAKWQEKAIVHLLKAWFEYESIHAALYDSKIGNDGVLGPEWARIGAAIRGLLNADCGRLDCGTLDGAICRELERQGYNPDIEDWDD
jgi:hypothetical protein